MGRIAAALAKMDPEDLGALRRARQVDEEELVEAPAAQQLGRDAGHVVRGRHHEDRRLLLGQPGEEGAEHAARARVARGGGKALLDLVDPEHRGGERFRHLHGLAQGRLGALGRAAERGREVEPQQREAPLARHRLGAQRFSAALHAEQQQAARRGKAEAAGLLAEGAAPLVRASA